MLQWFPSILCSIPGNEAADIIFMCKTRRCWRSGGQHRLFSKDEDTHQGVQANSKADRGLPSAYPKGAGSHLPAANRPQQIELEHAQAISACIFPHVPLWRGGTVSTACPSGLYIYHQRSEAGLLVRCNNNAEQAVRDHKHLRRTASFIAATGFPV